MSVLRLRWGLLLLLLLPVACDSSTTATPTAALLPTLTVGTPTVPATAAPTLAAPTLTATLAPTRAATPAPTLTSVPASPTADHVATAVYATITALAGADAATATARAAPTDTATPAAVPTLPAKLLGTYRLIVTARAEGNRIYQAPGRLILSAAKPDSGHSAEVLITAIVRAGHELADLSPGKTLGGLVLATRADLLPAGFDRSAPFAVGTRYDPTTKLLTLTPDPAHGFPGGWSLGPLNKSGKPRPLTGGALTLTLDRPHFVSVQFDLQSANPSGPPAVYNGGLQGQK
ncbi:MAG: hypothetical protein M3Z04_25615 [Chloroflexota bacterium]|nr:hypothetical protein [Chloroflexota bacterium]